MVRFRIENFPSVTYSLGQSGRLDNPVPREESIHSVPEKVLWGREIGGPLRSIKARLLQKQQNQYGCNAKQTNRPPIFNGPGLIVGDEARECGTGGCAEIQRQVEDCESSASLMKEEQINEVPWTENADHHPKKTSKVSRHEV